MEKLLPALQLKTSSNEMTFKLIMQGKDCMRLLSKEYRTTTHIVMCTENISNCLCVLDGLGNKWPLHYKYIYKMTCSKFAPMSDTVPVTVKCFHE